MESKQSLLNQLTSEALQAHKGLQQHAQSPIEQVHAQSSRKVAQQQAAAPGRAPGRKLGKA